MIDSLTFMEEAKDNEPDVIITLDEDGYHLKDTTKQVLDTELAKEVILKALSNGKTQISLKRMNVITIV